MLVCFGGILMKKVVLSLALTLFFGCTTGEKMSWLREGMTKDEVVSILCNPDGFQRLGDYESFKYNHRMVTGWAWDRADYSVVLKDGKITEWGQGEVRTKTAGNMLFIMPLR